MCFMTSEFNDIFMQDLALFSWVILAISVMPNSRGYATLVPTMTEIVLNGLQSVNGSDIRMGCTNNPVVSNGFVSCSSQNDTGFLTDGNVPTINMSDPDWAAELVTIKRVRANNEITFDHALMTFQLYEMSRVATIYLDLFFCPHSGIGAPHILVIGSYSTTFYYTGTDLLSDYQPPQTSCECRMSTIIVLIQESEPLYPVLHLLVYFPDDQHDWLHVGEVRFSDGPVPTQLPCGCGEQVVCEPYRRIPGQYSMPPQSTLDTLTMK